MKTLFAGGIFAVMMSVSPAFAMESETGHFTALEGLPAPIPMNDSQLAAIEGQAPPFLIAFPVGLVNVIVQVAIGSVRVIRDIDIIIRDVNVSILSAGNQQ